MKTLFSLALFMNFIALGIWLGLGKRPLDARLWLKVLGGLFALHLALGYVVRSFPRLVDPRGAEDAAHSDATVNPSN